MTHRTTRFARLRFAAAVLLFITTVGASSSPHAQAAAAPKRQMTEAQVLALQKQFQDATVAVDTAAIGKLMADDAIFVHGSALVQTKAQYLDAITKGAMKFITYDSTDSKVVFFNGGAVISMLTDVALAPRSGAPGAQPFKVHMRVSSVWIAKPAGWQLILIQGTPIPAPPAPKPAN